MPSLLSKLIGVSAVYCLACRGTATVPSNGPLRYFGIWVVVASLVELLAIVLICAHERTMLLYNCYWTIEFGLLLLIGQLLYPMPRWLLALTLTVFLSVWTFDMVTLDVSSTLVKRSIITGSLMLTAFYLWQFWCVVNGSTGRLRDIPAVWVCLTVLVYYGACGPLLGTYHYFVMVEKSLARLVGSLTQVACILKFILMGVALLKMRVIAPPANEHA